MHDSASARGWNRDIEAAAREGTAREHNAKRSRTFQAMTQLAVNGIRDCEHIHERAAAQDSKMAECST